MTINEILFFLNELDFTDKLSDDQREKIRLVKNIIVEKFEDVNFSRMLITLNIIDDIELSYVTNIDDVDYRPERTQSLGSNIFYLLSFKDLVDSKKEEDDQ